MIRIQRCQPLHQRVQDTSGELINIMLRVKRTRLTENYSLIRLIKHLQTTLIRVWPD